MDKETLEVFRRLAKTLQVRKIAGNKQYHLFLTRSVPEHGTKEGYKALARLICEGYFSTILTAGMDTALEDALEMRDWYPPQYQLFAVGQTPDEQIAATLEGQEHGIHIVKLYRHQSQTGPIAPSYELSSLIQHSLQQYFDQNIVIVGNIDQEKDGISALKFHKEGGIYYALPQVSSLDDIVVKCLHMQDKRLHDFLITGTYGEFNTFFSTLEMHIKTGIGDNPADKQPSLVKTEMPSTPDPPAQPLTPERPSMNQSIKVLYIYSSKDKDLQERMQIHLTTLRLEGLIDDFHDKNIAAGAKRDVEFNKHWDEARVILLLVSADFIASSNNFDLAREAMERHERGTAVVIPIILQPCEWEETAFGRLKVLPDDRRPITLWSKREQAYLNVAQGIRRVIEKLRPSADT